MDKATLKGVQALDLPVEFPRAEDPDENIAHVLAGITRLDVLDLDVPFPLGLAPLAANDGRFERHILAEARTFHDAVQVPEDVFTWAQVSSVTGYLVSRAQA